MCCSRPVSGESEQGSNTGLRPAQPSSGDWLITPRRVEDRDSGGRDESSAQDQVAELSKGIEVDRGAAVGRRFWPAPLAAAPARSLDPACQKYLMAHGIRFDDWRAPE